jgi:hypothetical protein
MVFIIVIFGVLGVLTLLYWLTTRNPALERKLAAAERQNRIYGNLVSQVPTTRATTCPSPPPRTGIPPPP